MSAIGKVCRALFTRTDIVDAAFGRAGERIEGAADALRIQVERGIASHER